MSKYLGFALLMVGIASFASAALTPAPEIDPGTAGSALALITGAILVVRGRRK